MSLLEIENLRCVLRRESVVGFARKEETVLDGTSLRIEEGSSVALLGGSGTGKTTLAKCIAGLIAPDSGTMVFMGTNIFPSIENRKDVGKNIQMVFQGGSASLDPMMTALASVLEGIEAGSRQLTKQERSAKAEYLFRQVGLSGEQLGKHPHQLSGGQRQRVAIARALAASPKLLILDEPTSALDALTSMQLLQLLEALQADAGFSTLYITHDVKTALGFCDRTAVLRGGVIVEEGSSQDLRSNPQHEYTLQLLRDSLEYH